MAVCERCGETYSADDGWIHMCLVPVEPPEHRDDGDPIRGIWWGLALSVPIWIGAAAVWLVLR